MGKFGEWTFGADYSFGRDTVTATPTNPAATNCPGESTDTAACRQWSAMAKYDTATWGVALSTDVMNGGSAGTYGGLVNGSMSDTRNVVNGWVKFGATKVGGGIIKRSNDGAGAAGPQSNLWHLGVSTPVGNKWTVAAQYVALQYTQNDAYNAQLMALRGTYSLFKGADAFVQVGTIQNNSASTVSVSGGAPLSSPTAGNGQQAVNAGFRFTF